jgi:ketol-acid reductoisomerase
MVKIFYDKDASLEPLKAKTVAIIGYGIQGRGQSLNLRDSGIRVVVAEMQGTPNHEQAVKDGFTPVTARQAAEQADILQILTQDHLQAEIYEKEIRPALKKGKALLFSHGFNIHFGFIKPPQDVDVLMVAPKGPGALVRTQFLEGKGVPCLLAIQQDVSGKAREIGLAYAKAIGGTRAGVIETSFKDETETDLFGEQAVLCGGTGALIHAGFEVLVEAGYPAEMAYFEVLHELKLITDAIFSSGIAGMYRRVSDTAEYGGYTRGGRVITEETKQEMRRMLKEIQSGAFAKEWMEENKKGRPVYNKFREHYDRHPVEEVGKRLRSLMGWNEDLTRAQSAKPKTAPSVSGK